MEVQKIEAFLKTAFQAGASDIYWMVGFMPKMCVNGELVTMPNQEMKEVSAEDTTEIIRHILTKEQQEQFEQLGEYRISYSFSEIGRCRVTVCRQKEAVMLTFHLLPLQIPSPEELGLPSSVIELSNRKQGLILVTGSAGSGKSTTLAAILNQINHNRYAHIITLEDPIEYWYLPKYSTIDQREVKQTTGGYASAFRKALQENPDVILVGELQDQETVRLALAAAESGHLVLSTLHTIGVTTAIEGLISAFPPYRQAQIRVQLSNVLESIISQHLIPRADGYGQIAAFEVLHTNFAIRNVIREGKTHQIFGFMQKGHRQGMITIDEAIEALAREGKITCQQAMEFA